MRLEKETFGRIIAVIRSPQTSVQFALLLAISLTGLAVVELIWPFRPRLSDGLITRLLRSWLGPGGPALLPLLGAVFLYAHAWGLWLGRKRQGPRRDR